MKTLIVATVLGFWSFASLAAECGASSAASKNCETKKIQDSKIVVGGSYSDAGGNAKKEAQTDCCWEKSKDSKAFAAKYGASAASAAKTKASSNSSSK